MRGHGHIARLECDLLTAEAFEQRRRPAIETAEDLVQPESGRLRGALLVVPEVGRDDGVVGGDEQVAGRSGEPAQVSSILRVGDQRAVELVPLQGVA